MWSDIGSPISRDEKPEKNNKSPQPSVSHHDSSTPFPIETLIHPENDSSSSSSEEADASSEGSEQDEAEYEEVSDDNEARADQESISMRLFHELIIVEIDLEDDRWDDLEVVHPYEIEEAEHAPQVAKELDATMMRDLENLNCASEILSDTDSEEERFIQLRRELRRRGRLTSGSNRRRTHSELSSSDDDSRNWNLKDEGTSAKRLRRGTGKLFQIPESEGISELSESGDSESFAARRFKKQKNRSEASTRLYPSFRIKTYNSVDYPDKTSQNVQEDTKLQGQTNPSTLPDSTKPLHVRVKQLHGVFLEGKWWCNCSPRREARFLQVRRDGPNKGRGFYNCSSHPSCQFFLWKEESIEREEEVAPTSDAQEEGGQVTPSYSDAPQQPLPSPGIEVSQQRPTVGETSIEGPFDTMDDNELRETSGVVSATLNSNTQPVTELEMSLGGGDSSIDNTDLESIFSSFSQTSIDSLTTLDRQQQSGVALLSELLFNHEELSPLYKMASTRVHSAKLKTHLYGFLRVYGKDLHLEAADEKQRLAADFIRRFAKPVTLAICQSLEMGNTDQVLSTLPPEDREFKSQYVNEWIKQHLPGVEGPTEGSSQPHGLGNRELNEPSSTVDVVEGAAAALSDMSAEEANQQEDPGDHQILHEVKGFILSAFAFDKLKYLLRHWLKLEKADELPSVYEKPSPDLGEQSHSLATIGAKQTKEVELGTINNAQSGVDSPTMEEYDETNTANTRLSTFYFATLHLISDARRTIDSLLVASGVKEPKIESGYRRVRWKNGKGKRLFDDYVELEDGGLQVIENYLNRCAYQSASGTRDPSGSSRSSHPRTSTNAGDISMQTNVSTRYPVQTGDQNRMTPLNEAQHTDIELASSAQTRLHLFTCIERGKHKMDFRQQLITDISNDKQLFHTLRHHHRGSRQGIGRYISLRAVQSVHFMKFSYGGPKYIDPRCHEELCEKGKQCHCIPPAQLVCPNGTEYQCTPVPPKQSPPVGSRLMMDFFTDPASIGNNSTFILQQFPKRTCGELQQDTGELVEAWGIYFKEGWNWPRIWWALGVLPPECFVRYHVECAQAGHSGCFRRGELVADRSDDCLGYCWVTSLGGVINEELLEGYNVQLYRISLNDPNVSVTVLDLMFGGDIGVKSLSTLVAQPFSI